MKKDIFKVAGKSLKSRLIVGTGKYKSLLETAKAVKASGASMVTVAVRRVNILDKKKPLLSDYIDPKKIILLTWVIVSILATVAGTLYGLDKSYKPIIYLNLVLPIFASALVGGIGSPFGAVVGGYVIAFSEIMVTYAYKKFFVYLLPSSIEPTGLVQLLSTDYKFAVSFSILVIVLLIRPSGIFKGKVL